MNKNKTREVYNFSACCTEYATLFDCRNCRGVGMTKDGECPICKGHGELWVTPGSWSLPKRDHGEHGRLI